MRSRSYAQKTHSSDCRQTSSQYRINILCFRDSGIEHSIFIHIKDKKHYPHKNTEYVFNCKLVGTLIIPYLFKMCNPKIVCLF